MRIFSWPHRLGLHALALLSPPVCPVCHRASAHALSMLCPRCRPSLASRPRCLRCGRSLPPLKGLAHHQVLACRFCRPLRPKFEHAISLAPYQGSWREAVLQFKARPYGDFARQMAHLLQRLVDIHFNWKKIHGIVPVPARLAIDRHPAYRLSETLARLARRPCYPMLAFTQKTRPQRGLSRRDRVRNMRQVLKPLQPAPAPSLLLVDDVMTTGATVQECARALKQAGAHHVYVALLAQGVLD